MTIENIVIKLLTDFVDEYIMYAVSIVVMTAGSMITTLYQV